MTFVLSSPEAVVEPVPTTGGIEPVIGESYSTVVGYRGYRVVELHDLLCYEQTD